MGEVILITSGKGGAGKTTATANVGYALSLLGKKVCLVDTDLGLRNLDIVLGMENSVLYNLLDVIEKRCDINKAVISCKANSNLFFLAAPQTADKYSVTPEQIKELIDNIKDSYDYILLDCPAGIEKGFANTASCADKAILLTTQVKSSVRDADKIKSLLKRDYSCNVTLVVNRYRDDLASNGSMTEAYEIGDILGLDIIGIVPEDENVLISTNRGVLLNKESSNAGKAFFDIALRLTGANTPIKIYSVKKGLFKRLFNK